MLVALTANAQSCPDNNHPHMIDLGLPSGTKWACCNMDTEHPENQSPTNYGSHFAWGETEVKDVYNAVTYQYASGVDEDGDGRFDDRHETTGCLGVWQHLGNFTVDDYEDAYYDIAGTKYDVAHEKWGSSWVMPSPMQIRELLYDCTYEWTEVNGVEGGRFTGPNGSSIFLPAAGYRWGGYPKNAGVVGYYWLSTQYPSCFDDAHELVILSGDADLALYERFHGMSVRPVSR